MDFKGAQGGSLLGGAKKKGVRQFTFLRSQKKFFEAGVISW